MIVSFQLKNYLVRGTKRSFSLDGKGDSYVYRPDLITIWHNDPEVCGDDDSCWEGNRLEKAIKQFTRTVRTGDYEPHKDPTMQEGAGYRMRQYLNTKWYNRKIPFRWHFWHWSFQVHPWQTFRRWAFDRCSVCGGRFAWKEGAYGSWTGNAIWHPRCDQSAKPAQTVAVG